MKSRRQRRIERRRAEIMAAAAHIFAAQGYQRTTTKAIADAADMAEGTLYNYFQNKRDILVAIAEEAQAEAELIFSSTIRPRSRDDLVEFVEQGLAVLLTRLSIFRTLWIEAWLDDDFLREYGIQRLQILEQRVRTFIINRIEDGIFRSVDPDLATRMAMGAFFAPILPVLRGVAPPPTPDEQHTLAQAAVDFLLCGLQA